METIRVNMTPCEDVQTIHASQNDNEAREWGFELHNNGEKIDSSSISDQMVFKAYEGGTEEILPTNGSTPITSPFKGDIKYPQGLLSDQEFTYRQSPTEEDGLANIVGIKGQTLKWNQTVQVSNIVATKTVNGVTFTNNSDGTVTMSGTANNLVVTPIATGVTLEQNHVYYLGKGSTWSFMNGYGADGYGLIKHNRANATIIYAYIQNGNSVNSTVSVQCIDFTKLFGETKANELFAMGDEGIAYFKSFFPLDYYPYNSGSLIPFNGNGIKTTGKNLLDPNYRIPSQSATTTNIRYYYQIAETFTLLKGKTYTLSISNGMNASGLYITANRGGNLAVAYNRSSVVYTPTENVEVNFNAYWNTVVDVSNVYLQLEFGSTASAFESYTESVINLPISTYFPTGMKQVGNYDELTPSKATTRIGTVTLNGSENWFIDNQNTLFVCNVVANAVVIDATTQYNVYTKNNRFDDKSWATRSSVDGSLGMYYGRSWFYVKSTQFADVNALKTWLQSNTVTVYYELATPTETSFTTASLVTENGEIPLSNEDGVLIGECTEELSSESGFFDAKIKLADEDGKCYSNKIQLHVERSPQ